MKTGMKMQSSWSCLRQMTLKKFSILKSVNRFNLLPTCWHGEYSAETHSNKRKFYSKFKWSHAQQLQHCEKSSIVQLFSDLHNVTKIQSKECWTFSSHSNKNCYNRSFTVQNYLQSKPYLRFWLSGRYRNDVLHINGNASTVVQRCPFSTDHSDKNGPNTEQYRKNKENVKIEDKVGDSLEKENIVTIPNILTLSRIVVTPYLGYLVLHESFPLACGLFVLAGFTDVLDGWIARNFKNQTSAFGSFLDPLADKLLISILFVTLSISNVIPVPLTTLVFARDICLILAAFYIRYVSLSPPITFTSYFDATNASAQLKPLFISKVNTVIQISLIAISLAAPVFGFLDHPCLHALWYATAGTTFGSGLAYMYYAKETFKIRKQK